MLRDACNTVLLIVGGFLVLWAEEGFTAACEEIAAFISEGGWHA